MKILEWLGFAGYAVAILAACVLAGLWLTDNSDIAVTNKRGYGVLEGHPVPPDPSGEGRLWTTHEYEVDGPTRWYFEQIDEAHEVEFDIVEGGSLTLRIDMPTLDEALTIYAAGTEIVINSSLYPNYPPVLVIGMTPNMLSDYNPLVDLRAAEGTPYDGIIPFEADKEEAP